MKTLWVTNPQAKFEKKVVRALVPEKLSGWHIEALPPASLNETATVPDVMLVQISDATQPAEVKAMIPRLAHIQAKAPRRSYVLFSFKERAKATLRSAQARKRHLQAVLTQINSTLPSFPNPNLVNITFAQTASAMATELDHIRAKLDLPLHVLDLQLPKHASRPSPLDQLKEVVETTADLRVANGNLSAAAIADAFGVTTSQLAQWLGRSRQALFKTPDADSLQDDLAFFERVARLRAVVPKAEFLKWLRMPNAELDNKPPLELLATGERQAVADLVDDMLTGAPA